MTPRSSTSALAARAWSSPLLRDVVSNYFAAGWMAALSLATLPIYVRLLGPSEWGIVAACMTLQGFLALLDVGFAQVMPRSLARIAGDRREEARVFVAYSRIYAVLAGAGFVLGQLGAGLAAHRWFNASGADAARLELALRLVLVQFLFQFANNAHTGFWSGMQLQTEGNLRTSAFMTIRHGIALLTVAYLEPSAFGYLVPFAGVTLLEWLFNRRSILRRHLHGTLASAVVDPSVTRAVLRDAGAFTVAIFIGLVWTQVDRVVLSATQDLTQYGYYVIVAGLGLAFLNLQGPLGRAFFPGLARADAKEPGGSAGPYRTLLVGLLLLCVLPCLLVVAVAPQVLMMWLHKPEIVQAGTLPLRLILLSVALNSFYAVIYYRMLSAGAARAVIAINVACLAVVVLTSLLLRTKMGIALGGVIWLAGTATQLSLGVLWLALDRRWRARRASAEGAAT